MKQEDPSPLRIHKFLAQQGLCSRREAEAWIREGLVKINGQVAQIGQAVVPGKDHVKVRGKNVNPMTEPKVTLVMNKPKGVLCTNDDPEGGTTVFDILPAEYQKLNLYCAGRLDKDSEGLLILTNDGDLAQKITHPSGGVVKRYQVTVNRAIDPKVTAQFLKGVRCEDDILVARKVILADVGPNADRRAEIFLDQGRKREIRRMFEAFGYFVKELRRCQMGSFVLRKLGSGAARLLTEKEKELLLKPTRMEASTGHRPLRPYTPPTPSLRERRYAAQKAKPVREDNRPFSHRALVNAQLGENVLDRFKKGPGKRSAPRTHTAESPRPARRFGKGPGRPASASGKPARKRAYLD